MPVPVIPDIPGQFQSDPTTTTIRVNAKAANTPTTLADASEVSILSPNNTGLQVNVPVIVQTAAAASTGSVATLAKAFTCANVAGSHIVVGVGLRNGSC